MKKEDIMRQAIGEVPDALIEAADRFPPESAGRVWIRWGSVAAVFVLIAALSVLSFSGVFRESGQPDLPETPGEAQATEGCGKSNPATEPETPSSVDSVQGEKEETPSGDVGDSESGTPEPVSSDPEPTQQPQDDPGGPGLQGGPGGVYTKLDVGYEDAKEAFGHPIVAADGDGFLGYQIGFVSQNGDIRSGEARCMDVVYLFQNGIIVVRDQSRMPGSSYGPGSGQYEYRGKVFINEAVTSDDTQVQIGYYPDGEAGIAYRAVFDSTADPYDVMDAILSLEMPAEAPAEPVLSDPEPAQEPQGDPGTPGKPGSQGGPGGVYTKLDVGYEDAKEAFGHPIVAAAGDGFLGYQIAIVSQNGDIRSEGARCMNVIYLFENGFIAVRDQSRMPGSSYGSGSGQYEYRGKIFINEAVTSDDMQVQIGYYPDGEEGIAYQAVFDSSADPYEVMDAILSLEMEEPA